MMSMLRRNRFGDSQGRLCENIELLLYIMEERINMKIKMSWDVSYAYLVLHCAVS